MQLLLEEIVAIYCLMIGIVIADLGLKERDFICEQKLEFFMVNYIDA